MLVCYFHVQQYAYCCNVSVPFMGACSRCKGVHFHPLDSEQKFCCIIIRLQKSILVLNPETIIFCSSFESLFVSRNTKIQQRCCQLSTIHNRKMLELLYLGLHTPAKNPVGTHGTIVYSIVCAQSFVLHMLGLVCKHVGH